LQIHTSSFLTACAYNRQSTLELHRSQSLLVSHSSMPSQLVVVVAVLLPQVAVVVQVELRGAGLLQLLLVL
jgi:hypothetical protein